MKGEDLKAFALLAEFSEEDREALAEVLDERSLRDGKSAFREGSEGEGLLLLAEGRLNLKSKRWGGFVGTLTAPYHLGGISLFCVGNREVTAIAEGPCTLWVLPRAGLQRLSEDAPRAAFRLAEAVAGEIAALTRHGLGGIVEQDLD